MLDMLRDELMATRKRLEAVEAWLTSQNQDWNKSSEVDAPPDTTQPPADAPDTVPDDYSDPTETDAPADERAEGES